MPHHHNNEDTKKLLIGILIGAIGVGTVSVLLSARRHEHTQESPLHLLGQAIGNFAHMLENHEIKEPSILKKLEKSMEKSEGNVSEILNWVLTGVQLWKHFKG